MSQTARQRMIDSLNGRAEQVPVAFWQLPRESGAPPDRRPDRAVALRAVPLTRIEHPHCAFYRTGFTRDGRSGSATVLHTPEGRLTRESAVDPVTGQAVIVKHFVTKPAHYGPLLSYLRDARVAPDPREYVRADGELGDGGLPLVSTLRSPVAQMTARFRDAAGFASDRQTHEEAVGQCIFQMKRLFHEQTALLAAAQTGISALWVPDGLDAGVISADDFHKYCLPRYRELHAALPGAVVAVEAAGSLREYFDDPRELPAHGCLALPMDGGITPAEALAAWPRRTIMVELSPSLCGCPAEDIAAAVEALCALPGARQRMSLVLPRGLEAGVFDKALEAALAGTERFCGD